MADEGVFDKMKPSDYVIALVSDEGTKVGDAYRVVSVWRDQNGGVGVTVNLHDGCGAGLNSGEYEPLIRADLARPVTVADAAKVLPLCRVCNQGVDMQAIGGTVSSNGKYWHEFCYKTQQKLDQAKSGWDECALILQSMSHK